MARKCATPAKMLNKDGGNQGNVVKPPTSSSQETHNIPSLTPNQNQP